MVSLGLLKGFDVEVHGSISCGVAVFVLNDSVHEIDDLGAVLRLKA